jgi:hypothetical protein
MEAVAPGEVATVLVMIPRRMAQITHQPFLWRGKTTQKGL